MPKVKVLIPGYAKEEDGKTMACSTVTLIQEEGINMIVDPGMDREALFNALNKCGLTVDDIDFVLLTHCHPDHTLLAGIFTKAAVLDHEEQYFSNGTIITHHGKIPKSQVQMIFAPGHDSNHIVFFVEDSELGKVAVAGDVFWRYDNEEQKTDRESLLSRYDEFAEDNDQLKISRKMILDWADWIVPGHGDMFKLGK
ncbi:MAG: MBL fold metallo-hydrolase [Patescibacteria group bacterium]|nr:MBL fold metallo-hydrolase [Patescibacteria group bacterium]